MPSQKFTADNRILESFPDNIRAAILAYAHEASLTPHTVIEGALQYFLDLDTSLNHKLSKVTDNMGLLAVLPPIIQGQIKQYADKNKMPSEFVVELAIAHFLDPDSVTFDDCQVKVQQSSIALLKQYVENAAVTAA